MYKSVGLLIIKVSVNCGESDISQSGLLNTAADSNSHPTSESARHAARGSAAELNNVIYIAFPISIDLAIYT